MAQPSVDFTRIREHHGTKHGGFEELCCQLAALEDSSLGSTFIRKGPGADQGLECYRRYACGREVGWQAKYFEQFGKTQEDNVDDSLTRALAAHPALDTFILCLPFDLRDNRSGKSLSPLQRYETWCSKRIAQAKAEGRKLEIELWSASRIEERLSRNNPLYSGRLRYWFDVTRLTPGWFAEKFEAQRRNLGERYTPESHVDLPIQEALQALARDTELLARPRQWSAKITTALDEVTNSLRINKKTAARDSLCSTVTALTEALDSPVVTPDSVVQAEAWLKLIEAAEESVRQAICVCEDIEGTHRTTVFNNLFALLTALDQVRSALAGSIWKLVNQRVLVVTGQAGIGKSHLLGDFGARQISHERPCILVLTGTMNESDPWEQIRTQLDLSSLTTEDFLGALDAAAEAAGCRAVITIDALNERHGIQLWTSRLPGFLATIERFPRIAVALTIRDTYTRYFPLKGLPQLVHKGFAGHTAQAAKIYLDRRGIARPSSPNLSREFENPLFLRTCCDFLDTRGLKQLPKGVKGITQLFDFYLDALAESVERALQLDHHQRIPRKALSAFLQACTTDDAQGSLLKEHALELFERFLQSSGRVDRSLFSVFLSEGVLTLDIFPSEDGVTELVRFTFERLYDHLRAKDLLATHVDTNDIAGSFSRAPLVSYFSVDAFWSNAGIVEAMAIQLPEHFGLELFDVLPPEALHDTSLVDAFEASLAWRQPQAFTEGTLRWVERIAEAHSKSIFAALLLVCTEPENHFNADYLHEQLCVLSLPERDAGWSVFLALDDLDEGGPVESLIDWAWQVEPVAVEPERLRLATVALTWLLSTSNRAVRDLATKGLVHLVSMDLSHAAGLLERFDGVNDPYVMERLLAACYGAVMQGTDRPGCQLLACMVWKLFFAHGRQPPLHILSRDYALGILEYAQAISELPPDIDLNACQASFVSGWPLETVTKEDLEDFKENGYQDSITSSMDKFGDFGNYTVSSWLHDITEMPKSFVGRTSRDIFAEWETQFLEAATTRQLDAYVEVQQAAQNYRLQERKVDFANFFNNETREETDRLWELLVHVNQTFRAKLDTANLEKYEAFAEHYLLESTRMNSAGIGPQDVDHAPVRRWVCARAHQLGWMPQLFSEFDDGPHISRERIGNHRVERVGKKYQRIALAEAMARITDNLTVNSFSDRGLLKAFESGPESLSSMRDIDPSLLLRRTQQTGWASTPVTWWTPTQPQLPAGATEVLLAWLQVRSDLCDGPENIEVTSPDGESWLILDCHRHWRVPGQNKRNHSDAWSHITCLITSSGNGKQLAHELLRQHRGDVSRFPGNRNLSCFLGEHGWRDGEKFELQAHEYSGIRIPCTVCINSLTGGGHSADNSVEEAFTLHVPSSGLMQTVGLKLRNGMAPEYIDTNGIVRLVDPSLRARGPSAAVASRDFFLQELEHAGLEPVWVIAGEKNVYAGSSMSMKGFGGRICHTTVYRVENGAIVKQGELIQEHAASPEQLKALHSTN